MIFRHVGFGADFSAASRAAAAIASEMAPCRRRETPRAKRSVDFPVMMGEHVSGSEGTNAQERPDDSPRQHRGLEHVGLEPLIQKSHGDHRPSAGIWVGLVAVAERLKAAAEVQTQIPQPRGSGTWDRGAVIVRNRLTNGPLDHGLPLLVRTLPRPPLE